MKAAAVLFLIAAIVKSDSEWLEQLGRERYNVMRKKATEHAHLGRYVDESRPGRYFCAACETLLFLSEDKYDAGSGWPCFKKPAESRNVYYLEDWSLGFKRYETLCRGCESHLGHVFNDGPEPKRLRYCINSLALRFEKSLD